MKKTFALLCMLLTGLSAFAANPVIEMKTSMGAITLELFADKAPKTVDNFLQYVKDKHYNGTIFHRVIDGFMIQGGGFDKVMFEKDTRPPIENEANNGLKNQRGTIAMARTANPHSATAQFFINLKDNLPLDYSEVTQQAGYSVFGRVTNGMEVVQAIAKVQKTRVGPHGDVPQTPIVIESVKLFSAEAPAAKPAAKTSTKPAKE